MNFENRKIEVSNLPEMDSFEQAKVENALINCFDKMERIVSNEVLLHVHFKQHNTGGKRAKSSVHLKLSFPGKAIVASETDWNPVSALQEAINTLEREAIEDVKKR